MKERIQIKHDIAANWAKAVNFVPLAGELIIYDGVLVDGKYTEYPQLKVGDGKTKLIDLPFIKANSSEKDNKKYVYYDETIELI